MVSNGLPRPFTGTYLGVPHLGPAIVGTSDELRIIGAPCEIGNVIGMGGQLMPHRIGTGIIDHHGGILSACRESPPVMRELDKIDLARVDGELENIPQRELTPIAHVIGKERRRSG